MTDKQQRYEKRIAELKSALEKIRDEAYSPLGDDWLWMRDDLPLGQFIDCVLSEDN